MSKLTVKNIQKAMIDKGAAPELTTCDDMTECLPTFCAREFKQLVDSLCESTLIKALTDQMQSFFSSLGASDVIFTDGGDRKDTSLNRLTAHHSHVSDAHSQTFGAVLAAFHDGCESSAIQLGLADPAAQAEAACQGLLSFVPESFHGHIIAVRDKALLASTKKAAKKPRTKHGKIANSI